MEKKNEPVERRNVRRRRVFKRLGLLLGCLAVSLFAGASVAAFGVFKVQNYQNLSAEKLEAARRGVTLYDDSGGAVIDGENKAGYIKYADIPENVKTAFVQGEDKNFFKHKGFDYGRIIRAVFKNIGAGKYREGGSTISQQLIKNTHLNAKKTMGRKLEEVKLTRQMEKYYKKERILELYLNTVYFGSGFYGADAAARGYFGKGANELNLSEAALLAGILPSPERYNPYDAPEAAETRRISVLRRMLKNGALRREDYANAAKNKPRIAAPPPAASANDYADAAFAEAAAITGVGVSELRAKPYKIHTYLDTTIQDALRSGITSPRYAGTRNGLVPDKLALVIDCKSGGVKACFGDGAPSLCSIKRQPGSAIKPVLVYAPALEAGVITPDGKLSNERCDFNGYKPENYGGKYSREITARDALATSANIPAVKILEYAGIEYCKESAKKAGITFDEGDDTLALALGGFTYGVTPLQLANSYIPFARGGEFVRAAFIKCVYSPDGALLYRNPAAVSRAFSRKTAEAADAMLRYTAQKGTAKKIGASARGADIGAKTGTVECPRNPALNGDAWCVSYNRDYCAGVWYGNVSGDGGFSVTGGSLPAALSAEIWDALLTRGKNRAA